MWSHPGRSYRGDRWVSEEFAKAQFDPHLSAHPGNHAGSDEGIAAQTEEVSNTIDPGRPKELLTDPGNSLL